MSKFGEPRSAIDNIVVANAGTKEDEVQANVSKHFAEKFAGQDIAELKDLERRPTPEELQIFELANRATNKILNRYGIADFEVPPANIHPILESKWPETASKFGQNPEKNAGFYFSGAQTIIYRADPSRLTTASHVVHEMIHFKGFQSQNAVYFPADDEVGVGVRRSGLGVGSNDGAWFLNLLDEAVTVELEGRVMDEIRQDPIFRDEVDFMNQLVDQLPRLNRKEIYGLRAVPVDDKGEGALEIEFRPRPYVRPRAALNKLIDALYKYNRSDFKSREEVFDLFARAALTGALIPLGRVIEKTFGPGTFRELGECDTEEKLEEFAKSIKV